MHQKMCTSALNTTLYLVSMVIKRAPPMHVNGANSYDPREVKLGTLRLVVVVRQAILRLQCACFIDIMCLKCPSQMCF